jgi:hypothetical protein
MGHTILRGTAVLTRSISGGPVCTCDTREEAEDARQAHLALYWDWDTEHADLAVHAVTIHRNPAIGTSGLRRH